MFSERTNWRLGLNRFTQAVDEVRASGRQILDLTVSNPTRAGLEYDSAAILSALSSPRGLEYDPQAKGLLSARETVAGYYRNRAGKGHSASHVSAHSTVDAERIVLTTSTSEGYSFVFRLLCNAGDELLVPKPSYPLFEFLADLEDVNLVPYPLIYDHGWQMDFPSLEQAVTERTRGVVVVHPNNPTGSFVSAGEREVLNTLCRRRGLAVIADEVFLDYALEATGAKPSAEEFDSAASGANALTEKTEFTAALEALRPPPASFSADCEAPDLGEHNRSTGRAAPPKIDAGSARAVGPVYSEPRVVQPSSFAENAEVLTFTLSGLSKISALPQMKVAWVVTSGPRELADAAMGRLEVIADTYLSMNAPIQWAIPVLLEQRKNIQRQLLDRGGANLAELDRQLAVQKSCSRLKVEGGWYAVLRVPVTRSDEELAIALLKEESVMVHPGHFYDFPQDGYLVLSLITPEREFAAGIGRVLGHINS
jgi:aspartate/methionine/tyrosine aminotransferase